ncbi:MAG: SGNH/GDSL hydrolase family protein, partial [Planctomycetota bacterium]|nr:SGNH/GDSL hydrolase family protein [Planctomycetota bacterium]
MLETETASGQGPTRAREVPRVLIIGDSISLGYTPYVASILKGRAKVVHNPGNA